eukprot:CAMPEP_0116561816 /NCGR_PEP_ID=MMETSP0397-20121206/11799_1 /TAXON_ID=216820 /ORGANISM="Cyclophora tenuis, Strain ECT3854" /LENGTH=271 /DNA_ID=CAMNT_0004088013 /DNA_START=1 /DNA_END=816 /DNA_ORIENTATION=-
MPGSQYSGKVIAALDSREIPHYVSFVDFNAKTRKLPSGNTMVPELLVEYKQEQDGEDGEKREPFILADSDAILKWLDETFDTKLCPTEKSWELTRRASSNFLGGAVLYYNWVNDVGYQRTMRKAIVKGMIPSFVPTFVSNPFADWQLGPERTKHKSKTAKMMGVTEAELEDEPTIRAKLKAELLFFQALFESEDQMYLMPGMDKPSGVDCSVYVMLERLVSNGGMGDVPLDPSIPEFRQETSDELTAMWKWYDHMREHHPIQFKGKRPSKN